jgi:hypothetical protein
MTVAMSSKDQSGNELASKELADFPTTPTSSHPAQKLDTPDTAPASEESH